MANTLYLIRGLPGAGKTTLAKRLECAHVEADMFFHTGGGDYVFDPTRLKDAHEWCQKTTELLLKIGDVAVSNTFTRNWEMEPYYCFGANVVEVTVKTILTDAELAARTIHAVPVETIKAMRERWEN